MTNDGSYYAIYKLQDGRFASQEQNIKKIYVLMSRSCLQSVCQKWSS